MNGVGANAQGPLLVSVPAGTTLSFAFNGSANQQVALVATPAFVPGQDFGGGLVVDVNPSAFTILFSGLIPLSGPLFFTGPSGTSGPYSFPVPLSATGMTLSVQGIVYDTASDCSGELGFMTTACFVIQFCGLNALLVASIFHHRRGGQNPGMSSSLLANYCSSDRVTTSDISGHSMGGGLNEA